MVQKVLCIVSLIVIVTAGIAFSQCSDPSNMLSNDTCGFDTAAGVGAAGWTPMVDETGFDPDWGTVVHVASGGRTSPGAMQGTAGATMMDAAIGLRHCFPAAVANGDVIGFGAWANPSIVPMNCGVNIGTYNNATCSIGGGVLEMAFREGVQPAIGIYSKLNDTDVTLAATQAATHIEIRVSCRDMFNSGFTTLFDDIYVGINMVPVELQSFSIE